MFLPKSIEQFDGVEIPPDASPAVRNAIKRFHAKLAEVRTDDLIELQGKDKQIENLLVLRTLLEDVPPHLFVPALRDFKEHTHCGTAYCVGGWVAIHPHFRAQGIRASVGGVPEFSGSSPHRDAEVEEILFGDKFGMLFDGGFPVTGGDDEKAEAIARVDHLLKKLLK